MQRQTGQNQHTAAPTVFIGADPNKRGENTHPCGKPGDAETVGDVPVLPEIQAGHCGRRCEADSESTAGQKTVEYEDHEEGTDEEREEEAEERERTTDDH